MITHLVLSLALLAQSNGLVDEYQHPLDACVKWDGASVTPCEQALFNKAVEFGQALEICSLQHKSCMEQNVQLKELLLNQPASEEKSPWSLLGMPAWLTPVVGAVLLGGGVTLGLIL